MFCSKAFAALLVTIGILGAHGTPLASRNLGEKYVPTPAPGQSRPNAAGKIVAPKPVHLPSHFKINDPAHQATQMMDKDQILAWLKTLEKQNQLKVAFPPMGYGQKQPTTWTIMNPTKPPSVCDIYGLKVFPRPVPLVEGGPDAGQRCHYAVKLKCGGEDVFTTAISHIGLDECGTHHDQEPTAHRVIEVLSAHVKYLRPNKVWYLKDKS